MALNFPASPSNGDTFAIGGITYTYNATKEIWVVNDTRVTATVFVSNVAPSPAVAGDVYWDTETGRLYVYYNDGDTSQWVEATNVTGAFPSLDTDDISEATNLYFTNTRAISSLTAGESLEIASNGLITVSVSEIDLGNVSQNIIPASNEVYNLGSADNRWKDLFLSGNTIILGGVAIKAANGSIAVSNVEANGYVVPSETPVGASVYDVDTESTGYFALPVGTTEQRPGSPSAGMIRYNSDTNQIEKYNGSEWGSVGGSAPTITSISGEIYTGLSSSLSITGLGFEDAATVRFSFSGTTVDVATAPISNNLITINVPEGVYTQTGGTLVTILVISGGITSNSDTLTIQALPTGGSTTVSSGYVYHTFTSSGSLTVPTGFSSAADYLLVAGGGGGGSTGAIQAGGGGGAGGYISGSTTLSSGSYTFTVGLGGTKGTSGTSFDGTNGGNTTGFGLTAVGGGGGGGAQDRSGLSGGSGGGRASGGGAGTGGTATSGQGNIGGGNGVQGVPYYSGGGGGAFSEGKDQFSSPASYDGGAGKEWLNGNYYAGGGGGGERNVGVALGAGGVGGGGNGGRNGGSAAVAGSTNTGGGGGGGAGDASGENGANGGSGIVIVRYLLPS